MNDISKKDKLTTKEKLTLFTAITAFIIGWSLTIIGFFTSTPIGHISESALFVLGQALLYCGTVFGISSHYSNELEKVKKELNNKEIIKK